MPVDVAVALLAAMREYVEALRRYHLLDVSPRAHQGVPSQCRVSTQEDEDVRVLIDELVRSSILGSPVATAHTKHGPCWERLALQRK